MPHFLEGYFWNIANPELWVGIGLVLFFVILAVAGVPKLVGDQLDARAAKIQAELDEAARLRAEAEALLAQIRKEKAEAEQQAADMLAAAEAEAERMEAESRQRLEEQLARRQQLAERRIAQAEQQAVAEVKAAAIDRAAQAAERLLSDRLATSKQDPLLDAAINQIGQRLN